MRRWMRQKSSTKPKNPKRSGKNGAKTKDGIEPDLGAGSERVLRRAAKRDLLAADIDGKALSAVRRHGMLDRVEIDGVPHWRLAKAGSDWITAKNAYIAALIDA